MPKEILHLDQIKVLVDSFYIKVREDESLGPIFDEVIQDRWPQHMEKMYRFWQTILLGEHTYYGSPFGPHAKLPIDEAHFDRWIELFSQTVDAHFSGEKAEEAKWRAARMADLFQSKIEYYRENAVKPIV